MENNNGIFILTWPASVNNGHIWTVSVQLKSAGATPAQSIRRSNLSTITYATMITIFDDAVETVDEEDGDTE